MAVPVGRFTFLRSAVISLFCFLFFASSLPDVDWLMKDSYNVLSCHRTVFWENTFDR